MFQTGVFTIRFVDGRVCVCLCLFVLAIVDNHYYYYYFSVIVATIASTAIIASLHVLRNRTGDVRATVARRWRQAGLCRGPWDQEALESLCLIVIRFDIHVRGIVQVMCALQLPDDGGRLAAGAQDVRRK